MNDLTRQKVAVVVLMLNSLEKEEPAEYQEALAFIARGAFVALSDEKRQVLIDQVYGPSAPRLP